MIYGPPALTHKYTDKFAKMDKVLCVGRSSSFKLANDFMDEDNDKNLRHRKAG